MSTTRYVVYVNGRSTETFTADPDPQTRALSYASSSQASNPRLTFAVFAETQASVKSDVVREQLEIPKWVSARDRAMNGDHSMCAPENHDRSTEQRLVDRGEQEVDADGLMACNHCGPDVKVFYCENTGWYHHLDLEAPACFLTR